MQHGLSSQLKKTNFLLKNYFFFRQRFLIISGTPFGTVPILEVEGKTIGQSNAIARYLAKKYNLAGKNEWESLECDILIDTLSDVKQALTQYRTECDPIKKEEKKATLMKETIPFYMNKFEAILNENKGFSVGGSVSYPPRLYTIKSNKVFTKIRILKE